MATHSVVDMPCVDGWCSEQHLDGQLMQSWPNFTRRLDCLSVCDEGRAACGCIVAQLKHLYNYCLAPSDGRAVLSAAANTVLHPPAC